MNQYLIDTKYAVKNLFVVINHEKEVKENLTLDILKTKSKVEHLKQMFQQESMIDDSYDDKKELWAHARLGKAFNEELLPSMSKMEELEASIENNKISISALSMSILQIAKQGISKVHGAKRSAPKGRVIGDKENLTNVIWEGRNQSSHHEMKGNFPAVKECFENLKEDFGPDFDLSIDPTKNRASAIFQILGWNKYEDYEGDIDSLLG